jgi:predicted transcriptional regulator
MVSVSASPPVPAKVPRVAVYLSEEVKEKLDKLAEQEKRSLSQMAAILLEESLLRAEQEGRLKPDKP